jgi:hypothetical protein
VPTGTFFVQLAFTGFALEALRPGTRPPR